MLHKPNILVVGSFSMDLTAYTHRVPGPGETVVGFHFQTNPGGKGANQAVQCAKLGANVTMAGRVGRDDFGKAVVDNMAGYGVDVSHVTTDPDQPTGIAHITVEATDSGAENRITICPGANFTMHPEQLGWMKETIDQYDLVLMQFELPMKVVETVARWAKNAGTPVMINPAPAAEISDELMQCATWLSPNEHEAAAMTGWNIRTSGGVCREDVQAAAEALLSRGAENVVITLGENGSAAADARGVVYTRPVQAERVEDTTAAGDSFIGAFCTGLCAGLSRTQAMDFASFAAAITVSTRGAMPSLPDLSQVRDLMHRKAYAGFDPDILNDLQ